MPQAQTILTCHNVVFSALNPTGDAATHADNSVTEVQSILSQPVPQKPLIHGYLEGNIAQIWLTSHNNSLPFV